MVTLAYRRYSGCVLHSERSPDKRKPQPRSVVDDHITADTELTFVDFVPSFCKKINNEKCIYHSFSSLVSLANDWLHANPHWKILNCETFTQYCHQKGVDDVDYSAVVRTLRVWIQRSSVGYITSKKNEDIFWHKDFKPLKNKCLMSLDEVVEQMNNSIRLREVKGKIINVETIRCLATDNWLFNPQITFVNKGNTTKEINEFRNIAFVIRVYYELSPLDSLEEIGLKDFVPLNLTAENKTNEYSEQFSSVFRRASQWISRTPDVNFCNAQAIDTFVSDEELAVNTRAMFRTKYENESEIRFLRIYFTRPMKDFIEKFPLSVFDRTPLYVASTSLPAKKCQNQINDWFTNLTLDSENYKYRILAVESLVLPPYIRDEKGINFLKAVDEIFRCNRLEGRFRYAFVAIRLYYDEGRDTFRDNAQVAPEEFIEYN